MKKVLASLFVGVVFLMGVSAFADVSVGLPADAGTGNCFPFGCAYSGEYQQVYSSSQFSGPITITALQFFNTQVNSGVSQTNTGNWTISLSTSSSDWNTLSSTFASNLGANNTLVFSGDINQPWTFGSTLTISLSTPFTYDPSQGNLLMDVFVTGASSPGGAMYFDTNGYGGGSLAGNNFLGRVYLGGSINNGYGLATNFVTGNSPVPEPGSLMLLGSGVLGVAGLVRRKFLL